MVLISAEVYKPTDAETLMLLLRGFISEAGIWKGE